MSATQSASTRRRCSSGAMRSAGCSGMAYTVSPPGARTLTAPSSSRSRDTVAWVAATPSSRSSSTNWGWLATAWSASSLEIRCWR